MNLSPPSPSLPGRVLELAPADMTVTVETGIVLGALQKELARHGQWLPIDPPGAEKITVRDVLAHNLSGPRRFGYGTIREHLIGMKVALADGRIIKSGGKVVKNVAGYDLAKLFIGARDTLGVIVEATFKLRPLPEVERFIGLKVDSLAAAGQILRAVLNGDVTPVVLDLHRVDETKDISAVVGFAGTGQEVEWQLDVARKLGITEPANLDYENHFWSLASPVNHVSVLPSRITEILGTLGPGPFVTRAGNGVVYYRGEAMRRGNSAPGELMRRIKAAYDPENLLPVWNS